MPHSVTYYHPAIGGLLLKATPTHITHIHFSADTEATENTDIPVLQQCMNELTAYFNGELKAFTVPLQPEGTAFQQRVWAELQRIPFGKTISYLELAKRLGDEKTIRAAASANGKNPVAIIIPCHRVIGANGDLTGYSGGMHNKRLLLQHEGVLGKSLF